MNHKQLKYAIALSKSLNFSQVAEQLGISQPALSKQILNLEKELGVELFDRTQTPVILTAAGEYFLTEAQNLLYYEEQLCHSMEDFKTGTKGKLTIGVSPFRALYLLPDICKRIREEFPGVNIVLLEDSSDHLRKKTADGKYDFAIVNLPVDESLLDVLPIEQDKLVLAVPKALASTIKNLPEGRLDEIDFKNCEDLPFITVGKTQEMHRLFKKICAGAGLRPHIAMEVIGLTTAWAMAKRGVGATILPLQFVKNMGAGDELLLYVPKYEANIRQPAIITRRGQYLSKYAKFAIKLLTEKNEKEDV